jgi:ribonuclease P protein component
MDERLGKSYKLCSRKVMDALFTTNDFHVSKYPFRLVAKVTDLPTQHHFQIGFSVPKRNFKKAPDRNKIKRLMREIVRKNKSLIEVPMKNKDKQLALFLIYTGKEILEFKEFEDKIVFILQRLRKEIERL